MLPPNGCPKNWTSIKLSCPHIGYNAHFAEYLHRSIVGISLHHEAPASEIGAYVGCHGFVYLHCDVVRAVKYLEYVIVSLGY